MASEIEVLAETPKASTQSQGESNGTPEVEETEDQKLEDVYTAAAYGDLEKLKRLVEGAGCSVSDPDAGGYFALQWSALNNRTAAAQYLIEHGADVNAADYTGQTALHWTAVRGSMQVAELLLQNGARLEISDSHGYRVTHVAAQYGHTNLLYHCVTKWGAEVDPPDNDGRSPLHWAAYKGFADSTRLLLFMDSYLARQDKEGCTPLHWAAIRGNLEACTVLVQAGTLEDLMMKESAGCTASNLAYDKEHRHVALFLSNAERIYRQRLDSKGWMGRIAKLGLAPVLLGVVITLVSIFLNSVVISSTLIRITAGVGLWAWSVIFLSMGGLYFFYRCSTKDPGFITRTPADLKEMKESLLRMDHNNSALAGGSWAQLCPTCKIVRPLRSKHCSKCDRCVEQFDHHCPWISNCVGKTNKWDFFVFLCMETAAMVIGAVVTIQRLYVDENSPSGAGPWFHHVASHHPGALSFLLSDVFLLFGVATLTGMQAAQIARNITTNEMANSQRYSYLKGVDGRFQNVYDHGIRKNCSDFLLNGFSSDVEVVRPGHPQDTGGLIQLMEFLPTNGIKTDGDVHGEQGTSESAAARGHHHVHSASCNHGHHGHHGSHGNQNSGQALGLGLGLGSGGLNRSNVSHQSGRRF